MNMLDFTMNIFCFTMSSHSRLASGNTQELGTISIVKLRDKICRFLNREILLMAEILHQLIGSFSHCL